MKRYSIAIALLMAIVIGNVAYGEVRNAEPRCATQASSTKIGDFYYETNGTTKEATLVYKPYTSTYKAYTNNPIVVPSVVSYQVTPMTGGDPYMDTLRVVSLGQRAFFKCTATSITFTEPCYVKTIEQQALSQLDNLDSLVIPASVDTLRPASIMLSNIKKIIFLGNTPPVCEFNTEKGYTPWNSTKVVTPTSTPVAVPAGAEKAYKNAKGIGDYFTCFNATTALDETVTTKNTEAKKYIRNGILVIERNGSTYDAFGKSIRQQGIGNR